MKPTHIGIDAQGVFCVEAPEKPSRHQEEYNGLMLDYLEDLEAALKNKVYFKPVDKVELYFKINRPYNSFKEGELYPIPEGFEIEFEDEIVSNGGKGHGNMRGGLINAFDRHPTLAKAKKERKVWLEYCANGWHYPIYKRTTSITKVKL